MRPGCPTGIYSSPVSQDGQRFLMLKPSEQEAAAPTQINVVLNWFEELKQRVPPAKKGLNSLNRITSRSVWTEKGLLRRLTRVRLDDCARVTGNRAPRARKAERLKSA